MTDKAVSGSTHTHVLFLYTQLLCINSANGTSLVWRVADIQRAGCFARCLSKLLRSYKCPLWKQTAQCDEILQSKRRDKHRKTSIRHVDDQAARRGSGWTRTHLHITARVLRWAYMVFTSVSFFGPRLYNPRNTQICPTKAVLLINAPWPLTRPSVNRACFWGKYLSSLCKYSKQTQHTGF